MTTSHLHVPGDIDPSRVSPVIIGAAVDNEELYSSIKPVRYRYVMAYLHRTVDFGGTVHEAGEVMAVLPMTTVTYGVGFYAGREMSGTVYLPGLTFDLMDHPPSRDFDRQTHPYQGGMPIGSEFECGNRAIYVMRNEEVVWGGILWTRSYSSGTPTMSITALSWEGYAYYRALRKSVVFIPQTNVYTIWYAVLRQVLSDFTWTGVGSGEVLDTMVHVDGEVEVTTQVTWTGLTREDHFNAEARDFIERWPHNIPEIELPPSDLLWERGDPLVEVKTSVNETFRGYDMAKVGEALQQWADTQTIASSTEPDKLSRFEYRVVCWFDHDNQRFRQRYVFGEMTYAPESTHNEPVPDGILRELIGANSYEMVNSPDNQLIFDFPGQISSWGLNETMEEGATRVIVTDANEGGAKHAEYAVQSDLLNVPETDEDAEIGSEGWLLYDRIASYGSTEGEAGVLEELKRRAEHILEICHVPEAAKISDLGDEPHPGQRTSYRSTDLTVSLYLDPTTTTPKWGIGDWATFAIEDPFYGGKMYLQRRIIGYTVTVMPDHESDYSHEQVELELTDETKIDEGGG